MATELPIVRKVGEGVDKPNAEQELPIDINYLKLVDFLVRIQRFREWTAMRSLKAGFMPMAWATTHACADLSPEAAR